MKFSISPVFTIFVLLFNSCAESGMQKCHFEKRIVEDSIGSLKIGQTLDEIKSTHAVDLSRLPYSDTSGYKVMFCDLKAFITIEADASGKIVTLSSSSDKFETVNGGKVGMSITQLQALHPEGMISTGVEEGGWIAFKLNNLGGYFEFKLDQIDSACLNDNSKCPADFYDKRAIRYWVIN